MTLSVQINHYFDIRLNNYEYLIKYTHAENASLSDADSRSESQDIVTTGLLLF
jgi:hypothetical protein